MTRLVNSHRDKIVNSVIEAKFKPLAMKLYQRRARLADMCYHALYSQSEFEQMEALPKGWLPTAEHLNYTFGTAHASLTFCGFRRYDFNIEPWEVPTVSRIIQKRHEGVQTKIFDALDFQTAEYDGIQHAYSELKNNITHARKLTAASLEKFRTVEKLLEAWPEIEEHVMSTEPDIIKTNLPAIPLLELNKILDLPPEAKS